MLDQEITIQIKNVYGEDKAYPVCPKAKLFTDIAGTKTLRLADLNHIKQLGYKIVVKFHMVSCPAYKTGIEDHCVCKDWQGESNKC